MTSITEDPGVNFVSMQKVLVTGATGYVGGRLVRALLEEKFAVRVYVRDEKKVKSLPWANDVEIKVGNANNYEANLAALESVDIAFYLLHSINSSIDFDRVEREMAPLLVRRQKPQELSKLFIWVEFLMMQRRVAI